MFKNQYKTHDFFNVKLKVSKRFTTIYTTLKLIAKNSCF